MLLFREIIINWRVGFTNVERLWPVIDSCFLLPLKKKKEKANQNYTTTQVCDHWPRLPLIFFLSIFLLRCTSTTTYDFLRKKGAITILNYSSSSVAGQKNKFFILWLRTRVQHFNCLLTVKKCPSLNCINNKVTPYTWAFSLYVYSVSTGAHLSVYLDIFFSLA